MAQKALKTFLKANKNKIIHAVRGKIMKLFGNMVAASLWSVVDVALTVFATSIGEALAKALDYADGWWRYRRNNGYILN